MSQETGEIQRRSRAFPHCKYFPLVTMSHKHYVSLFLDCALLKKYHIGYDQTHSFIGSKGMFVNKIKQKNFFFFNVFVDLYGYM